LEEKVTSLYSNKEFLSTNSSNDQKIKITITNIIKPLDRKRLMNTFNRMFLKPEYAQKITSSIAKMTDICVEKNEIMS